MHARVALWCARMERVQQLPGSTVEAVPLLAPMDGAVPPFEELARAAAAGGDDALAALQTALAACPPTLRGAESLIALLESGLLEGLSFTRHLPAREAAVEKLLTLDVYALRVPPEELDWLRGLQRGRRLAAVLATLAAVGAIAFAVGEWFWLMT